MVGATFRPVAAFFLVLSGTSPAWACPLCESEAGERVRAGIFDAGFVTNLLVTLLPFSVFLAVIALIHLGPPWGRAPAQVGRSPRHGEGETPMMANGGGRSWRTG